jgi:hypothetical protein
MDKLGHAFSYGTSKTGSVFPTAGTGGQRTLDVW